MGVNRDAAAQGSGNAGGSARDDRCGRRQRCRETRWIASGDGRHRSGKESMAMLRVAVVGGGIGGLSTAVALRATGAHVHVLSRRVS
jgi:NADPH-dependent 2,4-dienoyl-CoA reductase/sulfur reductase-like enzyme